MVVVTAKRSLRKGPTTTKAVEPSDADDELTRDWQEAIDGLRVLFHASPKGTSRERRLLLDVARNRKLFAAMRVASRDLAPAVGEKGQPAGKRWDFGDHNEMRRRYPRLYRRFGRYWRQSRPHKTKL